ncbi:MAG: cobalt ECF transporter T component CbiQ [Bacillota bacterium]|nr:cobalt ECF transporter T component CbiQ [Bacillota bacterium]
MSKVIDAIQTLSTLEELASGDSPLHRLHPGIKTITTFIYLVAVLSLNRYDLPGLLTLFFYPALLIPLAGVPFSAIFKRVLVALPFSLFAGISNIIFEPATAFYLLGIPVSYGVISFATLMIKTFLCVAAVLLLAATTSSFSLFAQLRAFHLPRILVLTIMMTYRYIFLLLDEVANMTQAYHLRAPKQKGILMKDMGVFVGQLILRCFDRSERIYFAMKARGFSGEYNCSVIYKIDKQSILWGLIIFIGIILLRFFSLPLLIETIIC